jgi:hypothetical protein
MILNVPIAYDNALARNAFARAVKPAEGLNLGKRADLPPIGERIACRVLISICTRLHSEIPKVGVHTQTGIRIASAQRWESRE